MLSKIFFLSLALAFVISSGILQQPSSFYSAAYFPDRSGSLLLQQEILEGASVGKLTYGGFRSPNFGDEVADVAISDQILSDILGIKSLSAGSSELLALSGHSAFNEATASAPKMNIFVAVSGLTEDIPKGAYSPASTARIVTQSYARDPISRLMNILTGSPAGVHGIVGDVWLSSESGMRVSAFSKQGQCMAVTLFDKISSFMKAENIVGFSASPLFASALAPQASSPCGEPATVCSLASAQNFPALSPSASKCSGELDDVPSSSALDLISELAARTSIKGLVATESGDVLTLSMNEEVTAEFASNDETLLRLLQELVGAARMLEVSLEADSNNSVKFLSIAVSSLEGVSVRFGQSAHTTFCHRLTASFVKSVLEVASARYGNEISYQIVALEGKSIDWLSSKVTEKLEGSHVALISSHLLYPELVVDEFFPGAWEEVQELVDAVARDNNLKAIKLMMPGAPMRRTTRFRNKAFDFSAFGLQDDPSDSTSGTTNVTGTNNGTVTTSGSGPLYTQTQLENFQIILWTAILFVILAFVASYSLFSMDISKDTLVFRYATPNRPHAQ